MGKGAPPDLPALLGSLESLASLGSQAGLGARGRQGGQERGENGERKENAENRAETALLASLDLLGPLAPRWLGRSQVLDSLECKDLLDSKVPRGSQAVTATEAPRETRVCQASRETGGSPDRGVPMAARAYPESVVWLDPRGSRVCKARGGPLAQWVAMETLGHPVPRVLLVLQDPRVLLA